MRRFGSTPRSVTVFAVALFVAGAAAFLLPPLTRKHQPIAETAGPPALFALGEFPVEPGQQACMESVSLVPHGDLARFQLGAPPAALGASPPIELVASAPGYVARAHAPAGHAGGSILLGITAPKDSELGTVCLVNRGRSRLVLLGSKEARTFPRSQLVVAGTPVVGEISLAFLDGREQSLLGRVGTVFSHASNLTDHLVPVWLIWLVAVLFALGVPVATVAAFYSALSEHDASSAA